MERKIHVWEQEREGDEKINEYLQHKTAKSRKVREGKMKSQTCCDEEKEGGRWEVNKVKRTCQQKKGKEMTTTN